MPTTEERVSQPMAAKRGPHRTTNQPPSFIEYYDTVFALAESPKQKGLLWAGTDDGLIHLTVDDGKNWKNVTPPQLPEWSTVSLIEPSPHDAATAYVAVDRHKLDDFKPYIFKTTDLGKSWSAVVA